MTKGSHQSWLTAPLSRNVCLYASCQIVYTDWKEEPEAETETTRKIGHFIPSITLLLKELFYYNTEMLQVEILIF